MCVFDNILMTIGTKIQINFISLCLVKTIFIVVGKTTDKRIVELMQEYMGRINHYLPFEVEVVPELRNAKSLTPEQQKVAKKMAQGDRKKEELPRKRERKPDDAKRHLMRIIEIAIGHNPEVTEFTMNNIEREATFRFNGELFRITLMKPREKKGE